MQVRVVRLRCLHIRENNKRYVYWLYKIGVIFHTEMGIRKKGRIFFNGKSTLDLDSLL